MKTHTFHLSEAEANNTAYLLGIAITELYRENNQPETKGAYTATIKDAERIQIIFESRGSGGSE